MGMEMKCKVCGRTLKRATSRDAGYGPVCYRRTFGCHIPVRYGGHNPPAGNNTYCQIPGQMTIYDYLQSDGTA